MLRLSLLTLSTYPRFTVITAIRKMSALPETMRCVRVHETGDPSQLVVDQVPTPRLTGADQDMVVIKNEYAGINMIDCYFRKGLYQCVCPFIPGREGAGTIVASNTNSVDKYLIGERVSYFSPESYAEYSKVPVKDLIRVPDNISLSTACAVLMQGLTAHYLATSTFPLGKEHTALVHAAAGGTGALLVQIAKIRGAKVIGTVSTAAKAEIATSAGCDNVINYATHDFRDELMEITNGKGVNVVYDSVGKDTYERSLGCLSPLGMLVCFGNSSGPVPPIDPLLLTKMGSLFLTRPTMAHYVATREIFESRCNDIFGWVSSGELKIKIDDILPLEKAADAHRIIEGRKTSGKLLLRI